MNNRATASEHPDRSLGRLIPHPDRDMRDTSIRRRAERPHNARRIRIRVRFDVR